MVVQDWTGRCSIWKSIGRACEIPCWWVFWVYPPPHTIPCINLCADYNAIYVSMDVQISSFWKFIFRSTLDREMKQLNATGNYTNKKEAQPITPDQENCLWELGLLGEHNAQVSLDTMVYLVGFFCSEEWKWTHTTRTFTLSNPALWTTRWMPISRRCVQDKLGGSCQPQKEAKRSIPVCKHGKSIHMFR